VSGEDAAARMHEARRVLRAVWGDRYDVTVSPWRAFIRTEMTRSGTPSPIEAMITVIGILRTVSQDSGIAIALLLAAAAEELLAKGDARVEAVGV
jgi:hypothetical protein